jgi:hypothetical protein
VREIARSGAIMAGDLGGTTGAAAEVADLIQGGGGPSAPSRSVKGKSAMAAAPSDKTESSAGG